MTNSNSDNRAAVSNITISVDMAHQRLDNFLIKTLKGVPRSHIYRIVRSGEVRVNKGRIKPDYKLQAGDIVRVPPVRVSTPETPVISSHSAESIKGHIIFENENFLVLNKPHGWAVHGGSGVNYGVIEALRTVMPHPQNLELVHRLDRDTSGCLMVAKKRSFLRILHAMFQSGKVYKEYLTLTEGHWTGSKVIEAKLKKNYLLSGERIVKVDETGQTAKTIFKVLKKMKTCELCLAMPVTGRTHQIRVHAEFSGHCIAGDPKYSNKDFNVLLRKQGLNRLFLHASKLTLHFPETSQPLVIEAPLDPSLQALLLKPI